MPDPVPSHPSRHSGPGFAKTPPPAGLEFDDDLSERFIHLLNHVPEAHRQDEPGPVESAEKAIDKAAERCAEHPFRALWTAHRHMGDGSGEVQLRALLLASEALWYLGHLDDARVAAQAALEKHPESLQAKWRLAVTLYKQGEFSQAQSLLDAVIDGAENYAPAWNLRGQVKLWEAPDHPERADSDFDAAHELDGKWPIPFRMTPDAFATMVEAEFQEFRRETNSSIPAAGVALLPARTSVRNGGDPDIRADWANPDDHDSVNPLAPLGGDFASGTRTGMSALARCTFYQRNIENLCSSQEVVNAEIVKTIAEVVSEAMRLGAKAKPAAPEVHAEDETGPKA